MHLNRENYLNMDFVHNKGLILKWKFKDFLRESVYFHHLFVLMTPQTTKISHLLTSYFKKLKQGDLIAFLYVDSKGRYKWLNWTEKSHIDPSPVPGLLSRISSESISPENCSRLFEMAAKVSSDTHCNIVTNFIVDKANLTQVDILQKSVHASRKKGAFPYICSIMGPTLTSSICISKGINLLDYDDSSAMVDTFHKFISSAALKRARVSIECIGGQLGGAPRQNWHGVAFNKIEKQYFGPSINYNQDTISFLVFDPSADSHFDFVVSLQLTLFTEQQIHSSKSMRIFFGDSKNITISTNLPEDCVINWNHFDLSKDPFSSHAMVKLVRLSSDGSKAELSEIVNQIKKAEEVKRISKNLGRHESNNDQ